MCKYLKSNEGDDGTPFTLKALAKNKAMNTFAAQTPSHALHELKEIKTKIRG